MMRKPGCYTTVKFGLTAIVVPAVRRSSLDGLVISPNPIAKRLNSHMRHGFKVRMNLLEELIWTMKF